MAAADLEGPAAMLASVGLAPEADAAAATQQMVAAAVFYELVDRLEVENDAEFPCRGSVAQTECVNS